MLYIYIYIYIIYIYIYIEIEIEIEVTYVLQKNHVTIGFAHCKKKILMLAIV